MPIKSYKSLKWKWYLILKREMRHLKIGLKDYHFKKIKSHKRGPPATLYPFSFGEISLKTILLSVRDWLRLPPRLWPKNYTYTQPEPCKWKKVIFCILGRVTIWYNGCTTLIAWDLNRSENSTIFICMLVWTKTFLRISHNKVNALENTVNGQIFIASI